MAGSLGTSGELMCLGMLVFKVCSGTTSPTGSGNWSSLDIVVSDENRGVSDLGILGGCSVVGFLFCKEGGLSEVPDGPLEVLTKFREASMRS